MYDTSSFHYKNLNKAAAGWKEIAGELNVSGKKFFLCVFCQDVPQSLLATTIICGFSVRAPIIGQFRSTETKNERIFNRI